VALIFTLLALVLLLVLALGVLQNSIAGLRTAGNDRTTKVSLAIAESGVEYARETLRTKLKAGATLNSLLTTAANNGSLVNATLFSAFGASTGLTNATANAPVLLPTVFGSGSFQVFLTNDRNESGFATQAASVQSTVDNNNRIMVTSFGTGPGGSLAAVQEQLRIFDAFLGGPSLPGVIVLPGPSVNFQSFTSNARQVTGVDMASAGSCLPTVGVSTNAAKAAVDAEICNKRPAYASCGAFTGAAICSGGTTVVPSTENFLPTAQNPYDTVNANNPPLAGDSRLIRVAYLKQLVADIMAVADFHSTSDPGFTGGDLNNPKILAVNGDADFPNNWTGAGIILVTGTLNFKGGFQYDGIMLAVGDGIYIHGGNGGGWMRGVTLIANINHPWSGDPTYVGVPTYQDNGGGNSTMQYHSTDLSRYAAAIMPLRRISFQQLR